MSRQANRTKKYNMLRDSGFTATEARRARDWSFKRVKEYVESGAVIDKGSRVEAFNRSRRARDYNSITPKGMDRLEEIANTARQVASPEARQSADDIGWVVAYRWYTSSDIRTWREYKTKGVSKDRALRDLLEDFTNNVYKTKYETLTNEYVG